MKYYFERDRSLSSGFLYNEKCHFNARTEKVRNLSRHPKQGPMPVM